LQPINLLAHALKEFEEFVVGHSALCDFFAERSEGVIGRQAGGQLGGAAWALAAVAEHFSLNELPDISVYRLSALRGPLAEFLLRLAG